MSHTGSEEASNAIEERLQLIIDTIPTIVWRKLPDGSADFLNKHFREYTGLSLEEGMGWGWMKAFHPDDRLTEEWRAALAAGKPFEKEVRLRIAQGGYRWFLIRAVPLRDERGNIVQWYGTTTDIDDLKRGEDRIRRIINTIPTMAWSIGPDGSVDFVNQRWLEYTGLTLEEEVEKQLELLDRQMNLVVAAFATNADMHYRSLAPAQTTQAVDYLQAFHLSYARFRSAQVAGDLEWAAKQFKAAQEYTALAAAALIAEAKVNDADATRLRTMPLALRRSPQQQAAFVEDFKRTGLSAQQRELLRNGGFTNTEIEESKNKLLQAPPDQIGLSTVEWFSRIAAVRRKFADKLNAFAQAGPGAVTGTSAQTFVVGNPHDKQENVDLFIRSISIPPDWKLSIVNAEQVEASGQAAKPGGAPQFPVREAEAGKHYAVTLPAKSQVKVASVVIPVGEVGSNTTARWAVEGKIGNELIGGMVHEMNVPYIIADLKLPPVGSKEEEEELPAPSRAWSRIVAEVAGAIVVLALLAYFFIFWRRRRRIDTSSTPLGPRRRR